MTTPHSTSAVAYSYVRFSHPSQAAGDSLRRQTEDAKEWCERNGVHLDESTTLHDLGRSAYTGSHRVNPDRHALAGFLKLVEGGKVPRGSYLLIENLDRLTREHIQPAMLLALNLLQAGIRIVQLKPAEMIFTETSDTLPVMMMMMELSRGHSESAIKSKRVSDAWQEKKRRARDGEKQKPTTRMGGHSAVITRQLPGWVEVRNGKLEVIPARAATVKRIYQLAANGYGYGTIVHKLDEEQAAPFGERVIKPGRKRSAYSGKWTRAYVARILKDRRATGEYQPKTGKRPDGPPIPDYFPAIVTEQEWLAARAGAAQRKRKSGRASPHINLFTGILFDALSGGTYCSTSTLKRGTMRKILVTTGSTQAAGPMRSFPYPVFEEAVLKLLREIDPHEILNGASGPDETLALSGELASVEAKIGEIEAELLHGDVAALAKVLRQLETRKGELAEQLNKAREKAVHPLSESWGEAQTLAAALAAAPNPVDARLRLRAILRRMVESAWMLVVGREAPCKRRKNHSTKSNGKKLPSGGGPVRLCAVQLWFAGDKGRHRDYLILSLPKKSNGQYCEEGVWWAGSLASATEAGDVDLRKPKVVGVLERKLQNLDVQEMIEKGLLKCSQSAAH